VLLQVPLDEAGRSRLADDVVDTRERERRVVACREREGGR
jgi:hypothetical protein